MSSNPCQELAYTARGLVNRVNPEKTTPYIQYTLRRLSEYKQYAAASLQMQPCVDSGTAFCADAPTVLSVNDMDQPAPTSTPGRWTLTATSSPVLSLPLYTCPKLAAAIGSGVRSA